MPCHHPDRERRGTVMVVVRKGRAGGKAGGIFIPTAGSG